MNELQDGILLRSNPETFALGGTINFKTDFLNAARHMQAPEVHMLWIDFSGTVDSAASTNDANGYDAAKLVSRFKFTDKEEVINCSGQSLRLNAIIELGDKYVDMTTLAAGAADAARTWQIPIPFFLPRAERPRDTTVPLEHFLEGGQLELTTPAALPTGWDGFTSGVVRLCALVKDGRRRELKSRLTIREEVMSLPEHYYNVYGSLRTLVGTSVITTTSASSWASFATFNSQTLKYPASIEARHLVNRYRMHGDGFFSGDPILAATPLAVPFLTPDRRQKIGTMPNIEKTVHLDIGASPPTGARLLIVAIKDRNPELAALVAGFANVSDYQMALARYGTIVSAKGKNASARTFAPELVRRFPVAVDSLRGA